MILITTSRRPTKRMRTLCNDLRRVFHSAFRINRGKMSVEAIAEACAELEADRVVLIERWKGGPGKVVLYRLGDGQLSHVFPILYLVGVKTQDDYGKRTRIGAGLVVTFPEGSAEGVRLIAQALAEFLETPLLETSLKTPEAKASLHVSSSPQNEARLVFTMPAAVVEVGPAMVVKNAIWTELEEKTQE